MRYRVFGHRHADFLFPNLAEFQDEWNSIEAALASITDDEIVYEFESEKREAKSISQAVNRLIKRELVARGWAAESYIFADDDYGKQAKGTWRLDFAKNKLSVEVAFNHRSDISWNLIKPTLASELNHVEKRIQTDGGIIVTATEDLKAAGGYDNACGTYEDYVQYLKPLYGMLPAPLAIIGLEPSESFRVDVVPTGVGGNKKGVVRKLAHPNYQWGFDCPDCGYRLKGDEDVCPNCGRHVMYPRA